jgi:putative polyhydroxyalkanoate system protein
MAEIHIVQAHSLSQEQARRAAEQVSAKQARDYQFACRCDGDNVMRFERSGVEGELTLAAGQAAVEVRLGFMMGMFAPAIQEKLAASMKKVFGA